MSKNIREKFVEIRVKKNSCRNNPCSSVSSVVEIIHAESAEIRRIYFEHELPYNYPSMNV